MDREALAGHLVAPVGRGLVPSGAFTGAAGGAACGDLIRVSLARETHAGEHVITGAGFDASGCGTTTAAGSAVVALVSGRTVLDAARLGAGDVAAELGGLSRAKMHAAELAADALHRALGAMVRTAPPPAQVVVGRTLVAMSGGVDSAVAAMIVAEEGAVAVGVTLELWSDLHNDGQLSCCSAQAVRSARELAHGLGMAHLSIDLRAEFREGVVDHWIAGHREGQTPNPCVRCNGQVRLDAMLDLAARLGAGTLVTGHYARVLTGDPHSRVDTDGDPRAAIHTDTYPRAAIHTDTDPRTAVETGDLRGGPLLLRAAVDPTKDQSYVLAGLSPDSLSRCRFPLGSMHKIEVRERARHAGLGVADRRDSQDLCFLAGTRQRDFLARHSELGFRSGPIITRDGSVLGEHRGSHSYTIGQRHGLGLPGGRPWYVLATDPRCNTVTVGDRDDLMTAEVVVDDVVLHRPLEEVDAVKIRSRGPRLTCRAIPERDGDGHTVRIALDRSVERTAPGQFACLYRGDVIVGHGRISI